uniref:Uncharacterized protein n=1 Tax=Arion vulgaris TaxID=1028688 RepID=A0A0B7AZ52_9EUPU
MDKKIEMDNNNRKIATNNPSQRCHRHSEEELAMNKVLDMSMMDLKYILHPFHRLCWYLSRSENRQEFSSECGHTYSEWLVYDAMIKTQPNKLPVKTFL